MNGVAEKLRAIVGEMLETEVASGADLERSAVAKWDSLNHLRVVMAVEEEFGVRFESDEVVQIESLSQLCTLVEAKLAGTQLPTQLN